MKKIYFSTIFSIILAPVLFGQATIPVSRTAWGSTPTGWTDNGTGSYSTSFACSGNDMGQLNSTGDYYQVYFTGTPNVLSYTLKATGATTSSCLVEESPDGSSWTTVNNHTSLPTTCTSYNFTLLSTSQYVRWKYTKVTQNLGLDDVGISAVTLPSEINLQQPAGTDQVCGFSYNYGSQTVGTNTDVTIRIQNLGTGTLNISSYPITGTNAGEFSVFTAPSSTVAASGFTDMVVRFSPGLPGSKTATLTINSDDADEGTCTVVLTATAVYSSCSELIISEYGEPAVGTGKYVEIFNPTASAIDLSNYRIWLVANGGTWPEFTYSMSGMLAAGDAYVVAYDNTVTGYDVLNTTVCNFNGNDAVGLAKNISGTYYLIDAVGTDGADPGTGWQVAGVTDATKDHTLVRKTSVTTPTTDWTTSAGANTSNSEWYVRPYGLTNVGCHINSCSTVSTVGFVITNTVVTEANTTVTLQVSMDIAPAADVTVNVNDALLGTAAAGSDYTYTNTALTFPASGSYPMTQTVSVNILNDAISESNENIVLSIDAQCGALISNGTHTITIQDDETPEGMVINEFGQGSNSQEYAEFVVTGTPGKTVDLRGWIFDDNSGIFSGGYGTQLGIAPGHLKFSDICTWEKVPVGSIIVVYNASDKNPNITIADDPTDADLDYTYVVGIETAPSTCASMATSNLYFSSDCVKPNNTSYDQYTPPTYTNADWNTIQLRNGGDALQVRSATGGFFHGISYGSKGSSDCSTCEINAYNHPDSLTYGSNCLYFKYQSSSKTIRAYSFDNKISNDYRDRQNWDTCTTVNTIETPGTYNNAANQTWILSLRAPFEIVTDDESYTCNLRAFESRYYLDASDNIIFYIKNNISTDHGLLTAQTILHDDATAGLGFQNMSLSGTPVFLEKTFAGTPTTYSPADYKIKFYFTTQELQDYCDYINPIIDAALGTTGTNYTPATIKGLLKIYRTSTSDRAWTITSDGQAEIVMPIVGTYGSYTTFEHDGFNGFSGYALGVTITELISTVLPVELAYFTAACKEEQIGINWMTASEENSDHFVVERSYDAVHFSSIAVLPAAGNSSQPKNYSFLDDNFIQQKQVYYRLKQVDKDGSFEYSNIVTEKCGQAVPLVSIYPNPTKGTLVIDFSGNTQQYDQLQLFDMTGRLMKKVPVKFAGKMEMDISDLAKGVYILSAENAGGWSYRQKIIKE